MCYERRFRLQGKDLPSNWLIRMQSVQRTTFLNSRF